MKTAVSHLIEYALQQSLLESSEIERAMGCLCQALVIEPMTYESKAFEGDIDKDLSVLLDHAVNQGIIPSSNIDERDAFEALLFDCVMPSPETVKTMFEHRLVRSSAEATKYLYDLSEDVNYIKTKRLRQNMHWQYEGKYGRLQMTINLAKPEKDPREIAQSQTVIDADLGDKPKCVLCKENERNYHNARMNLRIVPITLDQELWHLQYSPYLYYPEHAIILHDQHQPMKIQHRTFTYLFDFLDQFPFYFIGSNADLPIVGGSILNHDHFQGGRHQFPIQFARPIKDFGFVRHVGIKHLYWPLSTIRLTSEDRQALEKMACAFLDAWRHYENHELGIYSNTRGIPHQTITPIARKQGRTYELDLILRNNRTTNAYPLGMFHPHPENHHIKKENIGLIEAMGLAILPGRLKKELQGIMDYMNGKEKALMPMLEKHQVWIENLKKSYPKPYNMAWLLKEVGRKFEHILEDSGVFKLDQPGQKAMHALIETTIKQFKVMDV